MIEYLCGHLVSSQGQQKVYKYSSRLKLYMLKLFRELKSAADVICLDQLLNYGYGKIKLLNARNGRMMIM